MTSGDHSQTKADENSQGRYGEDRNQRNQQVETVRILMGLDFRSSHSRCVVICEKFVHVQRSTSLRFALGLPPKHAFVASVPAAKQQRKVSVGSCRCGQRKFRKSPLKPRNSEQLRNSQGVPQGKNDALFKFAIEPQKREQFSPLRYVRTGLYQPSQCLKRPNERTIASRALNSSQVHEKYHLGFRHSRLISMVRSMYCLCCRICGKQRGFVGCRCGG